MWSGRLEHVSDGAMVHGSANRVASGVRRPLSWCQQLVSVRPEMPSWRGFGEDRGLLEVTAYHQVHPEHCPPEDLSGGPPKPAGRRRDSSPAGALALQRPHRRYLRAALFRAVPVPGGCATRARRPEFNEPCPRPRPARGNGDCRRRVDVFLRLVPHADDDLAVLGQVCIQPACSRPASRRTPAGIPGSIRRGPAGGLPVKVPPRTSTLLSAIAGSGSVRGRRGVR
jgi:hypothetical protein